MVRWTVKRFGFVDLFEKVYCDLVNSMVNGFVKLQTSDG